MNGKVTGRTDLKRAKRYWNLTIKTFNGPSAKYRTPDKPEKLAYTAKEVASLLGISSATVYSLIYQKQIPAIHYGKRWIIPKAGLEKQLGGGVLQKEREFINEVERADLLATTDEALKLYDVLRGKLTLLMKNLYRDQNA